MSISTPRKYTRIGGAACFGVSSRASGLTGRPMDAKVPEWRTDAWKHHVEAEARRQFKDKIHHIGVSR